MLVLSRKVGDSVAVGSGDAGHCVKVTVLGIESGHIKLGFEGPREIPVHRWEVWTRINDEKEKDKARHLALQLQEASDQWDDDGGLDPTTTEPLT
jgi:carbon storage regulator